MQNPYTYTIFLDLLGYSSRLNSIQNESDANHIFELLGNIKNSIVSHFNMMNYSNNYLEYDIKYAFFSDSIVLSLIPNEKIKFIEKEQLLDFNTFGLESLITWIQKLYPIIINENLLLRGGISVKNVYWKENEVIGPALIEAYELESKHAKWARILFLIFPSNSNI